VSPLQLKENDKPQLQVSTLLCNLNETSISENKEGEQITILEPTPLPNLISPDALILKTSARKKKTDPIHTDLEGSHCATFGPS